MKVGKVQVTAQILGPGAQIALEAPLETARPARTPYASLLLIGLGGIFFGVTGPLVSTFVPPLVRDALGEHRTAIGAVMAQNRCGRDAAFKILRNISVSWVVNF